MSQPSTFDPVDESSTGSVQAMQVTHQSARRVAQWCGASDLFRVDPRDPADDEGGRLFFCVSDGKEEWEARIGDWVVGTGSGFVVCPPAKFYAQFRPAATVAAPTQKVGTVTELKPRRSAAMDR